VSSNEPPGLRDGTDFSELVREYGPLVLDIAQQYASDDAERDELYQDIWIRVWRRRETYNGGSLKSWLYTIGRNLCRDRHRRSRAYDRMKETVQLFERPAPEPNPLDRMLAQERREAIRSVVRGLPSRQRDALLLRLDGLDYDDIAAVMNVKPATVRSLASKGMAKLSEDLRRIDDLS
jgi:RNA polymerase sigma-70 factor (ECF subfamily)